MEVLILDNLIRPIDVVDTFISMIWTERRLKKGDFELVTLSTIANKRRFVVDTWISITESKRVMRIDTVEETIDDEDRMILRIKGVEISKILDERLALKAIPGGVAPVWIISEMTPTEAMRYVFNQICVVGSVSPDDIIPFVEPGNLYPADSIPEPADDIIWEIKPNTLGSALEQLADIYDLGIRLYKDPNLSKLYFNIYSGSDRTTAQNTLPPVLFSQDMENLQNTTEYSDNKEAYNVVRVVYIYTDETDTELAMTVEVVDDEVFPPEGFDRRVKPVVITNISDEITDIPAYLLQVGKEELLKSRPFGAFDGEINSESPYIYERDYFLGDLVEFRGRSGATSYMRVEEYIFVQDAEGQRSYPTFATKKFIDSGTWLSWKYDIEWDEMGSEEYWDNQ